MINNKIVSIFIIIILTITQSCILAQNVNSTDANGLKQGKWVGKHENGAVKYKGTFKDGVPTGLFTDFDEDGNVRSKLNYLGSKVEATFYHTNGKKQGEGVYVNKKKDKSWSFYDENEKLISKENYKDGIKDGPSFVYFETGEIAQIDTFANGIREGLQIKYFPNGKEKIITHFNNGDYHGKYMEYYPNGALALVGKYFEGAMEGTWTHYHEDGDIHFKEEYHKGKRQRLDKINGDFKEYFESNNDILKEVYTYKNGKKHGPFIEYYKAGEWKFKTVVSELPLGEGQTEEKVRYFDGEKVKRKGTYFSGFLNGTLRNYDEDGTLISVEKYKMGKKIEKEE